MQRCVATLQTEPESKRARVGVGVRWRHVSHPHPSFPHPHPCPPALPPHTVQQTCVDGNKHIAHAHVMTSVWLRASPNTCQYRCACRAAAAAERSISIFKRGGRKKTNTNGCDSLKAASRVTLTAVLSASLSHSFGRPCCSACARVLSLPLTETHFLSFPPLSPSRLPPEL